jgi:hypothetical protein
VINWIKRDTNLCQLFQKPARQFGNDGTVRIGEVGCYGFNDERYSIVETTFPNRFLLTHYEQQESQLHPDAF